MGARNPASPAPERGTRWTGLVPGPEWISRVEDPNLILPPGWDKKGPGSPREDGERSHPSRIRHCFQGNQGRERGLEKARP